MQPETLDILLALVISIVLHELAHGLVARAFGDETAQKAGRLTLNPLKHIDPVGSILVPLVLAAGQLAALGRVEFLYGWARPVPVQPLALRYRGVQHPRQLMAIVAIAGPLTNFTLAIVGALLLYTPLSQVFLAYFILINLTIGLFNLLPIPPLDGGRIAVGVLPLALAQNWARVEKLGIGGVLLLLFVLPLVCQQLGYRFNPFQDAMGAVLPWATGVVMHLTGHSAGANGF
jgi:Zn-dependent protease